MGVTVRSNNFIWFPEPALGRDRQEGVPMFTRKLFTLTAVAGLSLSLAACGDDSGNSDATATETTVVTSDDATTEETTTAEETTDSGVATETQTAVSDADATADRDIVFDAIDLVMAEHADGIIIDI
ncbi:MAG: hypothetical protein GX983_03380, partial [Corynebacterium sp.]|nr:hypothetical protein [Corynebacterium sp.]